MIYDIAIIGAGPAGLHAAKELLRKGKSIIIFEKGKVGGVSTHEGCIPAKSLFYVATMWDTVNDIEKFGLKVEGKLTFDYQSIIERKRRITDFIQNKITTAINLSDIKLVKSFAKLDGETDEGIKIATDGDETYVAKKVLIATGSSSFTPPIEGIEKVEMLDARTVMELSEVPKSITVIGGGVLGVEFAALFATFGSEVHLIERSDEILSGNDCETANLLRKELEKKGIKFHLNSAVNKVDENYIYIEQGDQQKKISTEKILLATGRTPLTEGLNLQSLHIKLTDRGAIAVNKSMQTAHPHVYAFGDIIGGAMLVHAGVMEADVAIAHIMGKTLEINYNLVPGVIYTNPEISFVGALERTLKAKKIDYDVIRVPLTTSDRYIQQNDIDASGQIKMLVGKEDRKILGVHILGYPASEFITVIGIAIAEGYTTDKLKTIIFPYPTVSRILREIL